VEIKVNEQPQLFPLAFSDGWKQMAGHEIKVGEYRFCAIPRGDYINISEVTTGMKFFNIPVDPVVDLLTESKESAIQFLYAVGERIKRIITKQVNFEKELKQSRIKAIELYGEMPAIENVQVGEW
jgi:hypothetical protein